MPGRVLFKLVGRVGAVGLHKPWVAPCQTSQTISGPRWPKAPTAGSSSPASPSRGARGPAGFAPLTPPICRTTIDRRVSCAGPAANRHRPSGGRSHPSNRACRANRPIPPAELAGRASGRPAATQPLSHSATPAAPYVATHRESTRGEPTLELRKQIAVLRAWWWLLVASVLLAGGAAFIVSGLLPKVYQGQTTLVVGQGLSAVSPDYNQLLASQQISQTYAQVATTRPLLEKVIAQLNLQETPEELLKHVQASATPNNTLITITAQDGNPARAAAIANDLADALIAASPALQGRQASVLQSVDADLQATQQQIDQAQAEVQRLSGLPSRTVDQEAQLQSLQNQLTALRQTYASLLAFSSNNSPNLLSVVEPAVAPDTALVAATAPEHAAGRHRRAHARSGRRVRDRVPRRQPEDRRRGGGDGGAPHPRRDHAHEGRRGPQRDLPPGHPAPAALAGRGGVSHPAHQHRVRRASTSRSGPCSSPARSRRRGRPPPRPTSRSPSRRPGGRSCWSTPTCASPACTASWTCPTRTA